MFRSKRWAPRFATAILACLLAAPLLAVAGDLVPGLRLPLAGELAWPLDLAVAGDGTVYVLGRDAADRGYTVVQFDADGHRRRSFGGEHLYAPLRVAVTDAGRIVVSEICRQPDCRAALVVFGPSGRRERVVDLPRGTVTDLASFGGELVGMVTQYMAPDGAHLGYRLVDVASGTVRSAREHLLPSAGVDRLQIQKAPSMENCLRDVFLAPLPGGRFVAGYSGRNELLVFGEDGERVGRISLPAYRPRLLTARAAAAEWDAEEIARDAGRAYRGDERCGYFRGITPLGDGKVLLAGRGERDGRALGLAVGADGRVAGQWTAPCELNWALGVRGNRAWGICQEPGGDYVLRRFAVH